MLLIVSSKVGPLHGFTAYSFGQFYWNTLIARRYHVFEHAIQKDPPLSVNDIAANVIWNSPRRYTSA